MASPVLRTIIVPFALASWLALAGCATPLHAQSGPPDFNGGWAVRWCDQSNPKLECGGFNLTLIHQGERICGDFGGTLVNQRQVDEGKVVGTVVGKTAVLAVESMRNQSIVMVRAEIDGDTLRWKEVGTVRGGDGDISVIATEDTLVRVPSSAAEEGKDPESARSCDSYFAGQNVFVVQGALDNPAHLRACTPTEAALGMPVEQAYAQAEVLGRQQSEQARVQAAAFEEAQALLARAAQRA